MPKVEFHLVTKWLTAAPKIARDTAPFYWTYLDAPQDGTIYLTWQPTARRGTDFASDGYVWSGPEYFFRHEVGNGLILEVFYQRSGFRLGDQFAIHSRRRFRLSPPQVPVANLPQVDPNLWIVHYGPSEKQDRIQVNMVSITPQMQQSINFRQHLSQMGQIVRKEFMLSDRVNWPQIPLPGRGQSLYAAPMPPRNVPQNLAYPPHPGPPVGPTPKRNRGHAQGPPHQSQVMGGPAPMMDPNAFDDDEDISRGDLFDHLSPREVAISRYQQNHEWMEEILSSPYRIGQIEVADLGLGRRGELASLTAGIFEAQGGDAIVDGPKNPYTGHLDEGLKEEFRKRVNQRTDADRAEIEQMKIKHAKMLEKVSGNAAIKQAEQDLRSATLGTGADFLRLEGRLEDGEEFGGPKQNKSVEDIVALVESMVGKHAAVVYDVHRVQDGGYLEPVPEPPQMQPEPAILEAAAAMSRQPSHAGSQNSGVMIGDSDIDMGGTVAGLLDQMHTGFSSTSTPMNNFPTPQPHLSAIPSTVATPANLNAPSPQPTSQLPPSAPEDVRMEDADAAKGAGVTAPDQTAANDDNNSAGHRASSTEQQQQQNPASATSVTSAAEVAAVAASVGAAPTPPVLGGISSKPASAAQTPGVFEGDNNDFSSLGDLDTAGDAMESYDLPSVPESGLGDLNDMDEDSAFGNAIHGVEQSGGNGGDANTPGDSVM
ncbi:hypothetical protein B0H66DRAFT_527532 [Apodospora peruviana]|uniref:DUF1750-domain-containing protein n=1 Tax=Apodospora peruviana TaxID=516989 RepID=A0AAE0ISC5_9PEZI|nr:hypothetical protein B0H66DRAFT_527532 [Apodospora peruviana]